jgi:TRAP transporter TAXI family solute receptor
MRRYFVRYLALALVMALPLPWAAAEPAPSAAAKDEVRALHARRDQLNAGIVGLVAGGIDSTYLRTATELAAVLDRSADGLRIFAVSGKGAVQNVEDVLLARGIDVGFVQSDVLEYFRREKPLPLVRQRIQYIAKLYDEEIHVLAGPGVRSIEDLAFKKVNFDVRESGTYLTSNVVFAALKIPVEATTFDQAAALEKLKRGEIAGLVYVAGKPAPLFGNVAAGSNLHLLSVPLNEELRETYRPARLMAEDYPTLVRDGDTIDTLSVASVMAVYAWPPGSERYRKVARFVDAFFDRLDTLREPPRHPKWREVDIRADVPAWTRFPEAEARLREAAIGEPGVQRADIIPAEEREALFAEFVEWRKRESVADVFAPSRREALFQEFREWNKREQPATSVAAVPVAKPREQRVVEGQGRKNRLTIAAAPAADGARAFQ